MLRLPSRLGPKLILSLTVPILSISSITGYFNWRTQKARLVETMVLGAINCLRASRPPPGTRCTAISARQFQVN